MDSQGDPATETEIFPEYNFGKAWNSMDDTDTIDVVVIYSHANNTEINVDTDTNRTHQLIEIKLGLCRKKDIETLVLLGCNAGLDNSTIQNDKEKKYEYSLAEAFLKGRNADSIGRVLGKAII